MNWRDDVAGDSPEVEQALKNFKASMDAWSYTVSSDAAWSRPRTLQKTAVRRSWRLAAGWALGCALAAGSLTIAVHEVAYRQEMTKLAAQKAADQRAAAERIAAQAQNSAQSAMAVKQQAGAKEEDLLASVDEDVSQQVPAAMEPLAQLMDDNGAQ